MVKRLKLGYGEVNFKNLSTEGKEESLIFPLCNRELHNLIIEF